MAESLALVWDLIARDGASPTFAKVGASAEGAAAGVGKLIGGLSALAVGGAIAASVKAATEFQAQMLLIRTQSGDTTDSIKFMSDGILKLAGETAQAPEALATSLRHVTDVGLRSSDALNVVRVAAEGAAVGHADLEGTTNSLTALIASGIAPTLDYAQAMGELNAIVGAGDMSMTNLNEALSNGILVTVKQMGVSLPEVGAALADFGDNNIRGANAATMLRMAVQALEQPTRKGEDVLASYHIAADAFANDLQKGGLTLALHDLNDKMHQIGITADEQGKFLTDVFGKKAGAGVLILEGTLDRFDTKLGQVKQGAEDFQSAWDQTTKLASFQFTALKDAVDAVGIQIGTNLLPVLGGLADWFTKTAIPNVEHFASALSSAAQSPQFQSFLKDVVTIGGQAWTAIQNFAGVLRDLGGAILPPLLSAGGELVKVFAGLPGPVQLAAVAFAALRFSGGLEFFDRIGPAAGGVGTAFRNFGADVSATSGVLAAAGVPLSGFTAALQTTAERGMGVLRSGAQGAINLLGGPWGASLAIAGGAAAGFAASLQNINDVAQTVTESLKSGGPMSQALQDLETNQSRSIADAHSWKDAMNIAGAAFDDSAAQLRGYSSAADEAKTKGQDAYDAWYGGLNRVDKAQADLTKAQDEYNRAVSNYGANSAQAMDAARQLQSANEFLTTTQKDVNQATKDHLSLLTQQSNMELAAVNSHAALQIAELNLTSAMDDYNAKVKDGTLKGDALKKAQADLEQQMIRTATQTAQDAADTAKANGVTDTSITYNNVLHDTLQKLADKYDGPVHDALQQAADATGKAAIKTDDFRDATDKLQLRVGQAWPDGTRVVQEATQQQIQALQQLGFHVTTLPGSDPNKPQTIFVTANTSQAYQQLTDFEKRANDLGFVGAMWNVGAPIGNGNAGSQNPVGLPPIPGVPHKATGGLMVGPGSGTSDSIHAMLSNGEFVVNAKATSQHMELLHAINSGAVGAFAQGGLVWDAALSSKVMGNLNAGLAAKQAAAAAVAGMIGVPASRAGNEAAVNHAASYYGWNSGIQWADLVAVIMRESGFNNVAQNPTSTAYGMFQFLDSTWRNYGGSKTSDSAEQSRMGMTYIFDRYGSPAAALAHENSFGWYKNGTNYVPSDQLAVLHKGEAVVPASKNQGAPYVGGGAITLQLDREAVTDLLDGRIVSFADGMYHRAEFNG